MSTTEKFHSPITDRDKNLVKNMVRRGALARSQARLEKFAFRVLLELVSSANTSTAQRAALAILANRKQKVKEAQAKRKQSSKGKKRVWDQAIMDMANKMAGEDNEEEHS